MKDGWFGDWKVGGVLDQCIKAEEEEVRRSMWGVGGEEVMVMV